MRRRDPAPVYPRVRMAERDDVDRYAGPVMPVSVLDDESLGVLSRGPWSDGADPCLPAQARRGRLRGSAVASADGGGCGAPRSTTSWRSLRGRTRVGAVGALRGLRVGREPELRTTTWSRSSRLGSETQTECDEHRPGDAFDQPSTRGGEEEVAPRCDGERVAAEPHERHRAEDEAPAEGGERLAAELGSRLAEDTAIRVPEFAQQALGTSYPPPERSRRAARWPQRLECRGGRVGGAGDSDGEERGLRSAQDRGEPH